MQRVRLLIAEPDPIRREQLARHLSRRRDVELLGASQRLLDGLRGLRLGSPPVDVVIANADSPEVTGIDYWLVVAVVLPEAAKIIALTRGDDDRVLGTLVSHSRIVKGILSVDRPPQAIYRAIRQVAHGGRCDDPALVARVKSVLMNHDPANGLMVAGELQIDLSVGSSFRAGKPIRLTELEAGVLHYMARNSGKPVSTYELLEAVWEVGMGDGGTADQVKSCIWRLRRKIEPVPGNPRYLTWVRGKGYVLNVIPSDGRRASPAHAVLAGA